MSEYNISLKATLDSSQVQQELDKISSQSRGSFGLTNGNNSNSAAPASAESSKLGASIDMLAKQIRQLIQQLNLARSATAQSDVKVLNNTSSNAQIEQIKDSIANMSRLNQQADNASKLSNKSEGMSKAAAQEQTLRQTLSQLDKSIQTLNSSIRLNTKQWRNDNSDQSTNSASDALMVKQQQALRQQLINGKLLANKQTDINNLFADGNIVQGIQKKFNSAWNSIPNDKRIGLSNRFNINNRSIESFIQGGSPQTLDNLEKVYSQISGGSKQLFKNQGQKQKLLRLQNVFAKNFDSDSYADIRTLMQDDESFARNLGVRFDKKTGRFEKYDFKKDQANQQLGKNLTRAIGGQIIGHEVGALLSQFGSSNVKEGLRDIDIQQLNKGYWQSVGGSALMKGGTGLGLGLAAGSGAGSAPFAVAGGLIGAGLGWFDTHQSYKQTMKDLSYDNPKVIQDNKKRLEQMDKLSKQFWFTENLKTTQLEDIKSQKPKAQEAYDTEKRTYKAAQDRANKAVERLTADFEKEIASMAYGSDEYVMAQSRYAKALDDIRKATEEHGDKVKEAKSQLDQLTQAEKALTDSFTGLQDWKRAIKFNNETRDIENRNADEIQQKKLENKALLDKATKERDDYIREFEKKGAITAEEIQKFEEKKSELQKNVDLAQQEYDFYDAQAKSMSNESYSIGRKLNSYDKTKEAVQSQLDVRSILYNGISSQEKRSQLKASLDDLTTKRRDALTEARSLYEKANGSKTTQLERENLIKQAQERESDADHFGSMMNEVANAIASLQSVSAPDISNITSLSQYGLGSLNQASDDEARWRQQENYLRDTLNVLKQTLEVDKQQLESSTTWG